MPKTKVRFKRDASYYGGDEYSGAEYDERQSHFFTIGAGRVRVVFLDSSLNAGSIAMARDPDPDRKLWPRPKARWRVVFRGTVRQVEAEFLRRFGHKFSCVGRKGAS
jgi:hypothetical protein